MECKRIIAGLFIYAGFASSVFSQTTGKIVDTNQHPVEGATIVMQLPDSTYLGATISAADGTFILEPEELSAYYPAFALSDQAGEGPGT